MITQSRLRELFSYDENTGRFTRLSTGKIAAPMQRGYRNITIDGYQYVEHRLVWLYVHGYFPSSDIDHINGVKSDNRISNLRLASRTQNLGNQPVHRHSRTGLKGVFIHDGRFRARLTMNGKRYNLGSFKTAEDAHAAYAAAAKIHFGEFARTA